MFCLKWITKLFSWGTNLSLLVGFALLFFTGQTIAANINLTNHIKSKAAKTALKNNIKIQQQSNRRIIVRFKSDTQGNVKSRLHANLNSSVKKSFKLIPGIQVVEVAPGSNIGKVLQKYRQDPSVLYAEPDYIIRPAATNANDSFFDQLWGLNNTGQGAAVSDADINAPEAWDRTTGSNNVAVAVLDTGIDYTHVDLVGNIWTNPGEIPGNNIDDDGNGYRDDIHGIDTADGDSDPIDDFFHGTHVAGSIGASGNNNIGVTGVNWNTSIIACKIFPSNTPTGQQGFVSNAVECLDYLVTLKTEYGVNIIASNNSWGWVGAPSRALEEAIQRQMDAGILFIASAGNDSSDNDEMPHYPSSYYLSNLIAVAASTDTDDMAGFSSYGRRSVHVSAPGHKVLSTVTGWDMLPPENPHNDIFFDDFENGIGSWSAQSPWGLTTTDFHSSNHSLTDSPVGNYANNEYKTVTSPVINLAPFANDIVYLGFYTRFDLAETDYLLLEFKDANGDWILFGAGTGSSQGWGFVSFQILPEYLHANFQLRIDLLSDSSGTADGIYIDDVGIGITQRPAATAYGIASGTSMAAPHVTGLAALLKSDDNSRDWIQLKNLIISSGTPGPAFNNVTVSGRRIRAFDTDNTGAMTCTDQTILSRLQPAPDELAISPGEVVNVSMLHINCGEPAGNVEITITETGDTVTLLDNGLGFDQVANDGVYSAQIDLTTLSQENITIEFPDSTTVSTITPVEYLPPVTIPQEWRNTVAVEQAVFTDRVDFDPYDDDTRIIDAPFPVQFGSYSIPFDKLVIDTNGYIILQRTGDIPITFSMADNTEIPTSVNKNRLAIFWDNLILDNLPGSDANVYWAVLGNAPNRELVVTWRNIGAVGPAEPGYTFQIVFTEGSTDILFNYLDSTDPQGFASLGIGATSGIQVAQSFGTQYSFNQSVLNSGLSLRWSMPDGASGAPTTPTTPTTPPTTSRAAPGGGGGSFLMMVILLLPLLLLSRFLKGIVIRKPGVDAE